MKLIFLGMQKLPKKETCYEITGKDYVYNAEMLTYLTWYHTKSALSEELEC